MRTNKKQLAQAALLQAIEELKFCSHCLDNGTDMYDLDIESQEIRDLNKLRRQLSIQESELEVLHVALRRAGAFKTSEEG
jgi:3-dehydroquinate synthase class II